MCPALDGGDFAHLTITRMLTIVEAAVNGGQVVLMGSSLGGYVAALYASQHPEQVERMIALAPAFRFLERWQHRFTPQQLDEWRQRGSLPVYHYGTKSEQPLSYQRIDDAAQYPPEPAFPQPTLILHGTADEVVPSSGSEELAAQRSNITLKLFSSGHELTDVLDQLWQQTARFLQIVHN